MDGLGEMGRNLGSAVMRFELVDSVEDKMFPDPVVVQTKPCAVSRHLFWDEQVSLFVPSCAMTERESCKFKVIISVLSAPYEQDKTFARAEKSLFEFIQHIVEVSDGVLSIKNERYDSVVALSICDAIVAVEALSKERVKSGNIRVRLGLMLFEKRLGSAQNEDIVGSYDKAKLTCKNHLI